MTVADVYEELNLFNRDLMTLAGVELPNDFKRQDLAMPAYRLSESKYRFVLAGVNDMGQVFVTGFSMINRMQRIRKQWQKAGFKYFVVCENIGGK